jgi:uncharacterized membrane protein
MSTRKLSVGRFLMPLPFLIFTLALLGAGGILYPLLGFTRGVMAAFDIGASAFLISCLHLFSFAAPQMREAVSKNDANRGSLLLVSAAVTGVILAAVASELSQKGRPHLPDLILVIVTLCLCWIFSNLVYALHYAHLFYTRDETGQDTGGLKFPDTKEPNYWDFAYFSSCLGMTFQTSDIEMTSRSFRRTAMFHCLGAFVFNLGVIAFRINILGSS